jgi:hypothetical protein
LSCGSNGTQHADNKTLNRYPLLHSYSPNSLAQQEMGEREMFAIPETSFQYQKYLYRFTNSFAYEPINLQTKLLFSNQARARISSHLCASPAVSTVGFSGRSQSITSSLRVSSVTHRTYRGESFETVREMKVNLSESTRVSLRAFDLFIQSHAAATRT